MQVKGLVNYLKLINFCKDLCLLSPKSCVLRFLRSGFYHGDCFHPFFKSETTASQTNDLRVNFKVLLTPKWSFLHSFNHLNSVFQIIYKRINEFVFVPVSILEEQ